MTGKVLVINHHDWLSPRIRNEVQTLIQDGYSIHVVYLHRDGSKENPVEDNLDNGVLTTHIYQRMPLRSALQFCFLPLLYAKLLYMLRYEKPRIVHCTHLFLLPLCVVFGKLKRAEVIYDASEMHALDWAAYLPAGLSRIGRKVVEFAENVLVSQIDGVLTIDSVGGFIVERYKRVNSNAVVLYNVPQRVVPTIDDEDIAPLHGKLLGSQVLVYVGSTYEAKGLVATLEAFALARRKFPRLKLLFVGLFHDPEGKAKGYIIKAGLQEAVEVVSWVPYEKLLCYLKACAIGLAMHQPQGRFWYVSRGNGRKFFTYMQAGLPIVGPSFSEIGAVVQEERCGLLVDTTDPAEVAEAIQYLLEHPEEARAMGERGQQAIREKYNWEIEERKLLAVYRKLGR